MCNVGDCMGCEYGAANDPWPFLRARAVPDSEDVRCTNCAALSAAPLCDGCRANIDYGLSC